jgi:FMN phosphatase YigB (HAD superfamily)
VKIRAIIFDIYNTLLAVGPAPASADERWRQLCEGLGTAHTVLPLAEFNAQCQAEIAQDHAAAHGCGVQFPEVCWRDLTQRVLPALKQLSAQQADDFLFGHAQLQRTIALMPGAGELLAELHRQGVILGLCSNAQPYTLRELEQALAIRGLGLQVFDPDLCFFSFQAGFSKPDSRAFRGLQIELSRRSIALTEALFVGDRLDNDIRPAQSAGWPTWHLASASQETWGGDWFQLLQFVFASDRSLS